MQFSHTHLDTELKDPLWVDHLPYPLMEIIFSQFLRLPLVL